MNNWQEWVAGTDPTKAMSLLKLLSPSITPPGLLLSWNSDTNHTYYILRASSLNSPLAFATIATNIPGLPVTTTFLDPSAPGAGGAFYRVGTFSTNVLGPLLLEQPRL